MQRAPQRGPVRPELYPVAPGPKYQHYGEQQGWIYNPYKDQYEPDPKTAQQWGESVGLIEPEKKPPGAFQQILPVAGVAAAGMAGKEIASHALADGVSGVPGNIAQGASKLWNSLLGSGGASQAQNPGMMGGISNAAGQSVTPYIDSLPAQQAAAGAEATGAGAGMMGNFAQMGIGPQAGIMAGLALGAKGAKDFLAGKSGLDSPEGIGGRVTLGIATGGISEIARLAGLAGQKSTKEYQRERWNEVSESGNPGWGQFYEQNKEMLEGGGPDEGKWTEETDPTGKYVGEKWSLAAQEDIAKETGNYDGYIGQYAHAEAFGDKWLTTPIDKQREFIERAVGEGLYSSDKGSVLFSGKKGDLDRARELYDEVMNPEGEEIPLPDTSGGPNDPNRNPGMMGNAAA